MLRLYDELADWWPLLSPPSHYNEEAGFFIKVLQENGFPDSSTLLELGSGGGNNASFLKQHFRMSLTDVSPSMLAISRRLNPECEHIQGDMRDLRLNRVFDIVFVHDAVMYMTTADDLQRAIKTAHIHCRTGGITLFVPDYVQETFQPSTTHGGVDGTDRGLRYLTWTYDPDNEDTEVTSDMVYLMRRGDDSVSVELDRHIMGIFARSIWLDLFQQVGFDIRIKRDSFGRELFIGRKS